MSYFPDFYPVNPDYPDSSVFVLERLEKKLDIHSRPKFCEDSEFSVKNDPHPLENRFPEFPVFPESGNVGRRRHYKESKFIFRYIHILEAHTTLRSVVYRQKSILRFLLIAHPPLMK